MRKRGLMRDLRLTFHYAELNISGNLAGKFLPLGKGD